MPHTQRLTAAKAVHRAIGRSAGAVKVTQNRMSGGNGILLLRRGTKPKAVYRAVQTGRCRRGGVPGGAVYRTEQTGRCKKRNKMPSPPNRTGCPAAAFRLKDKSIPFFTGPTVAFTGRAPGAATKKGDYSVPPTDMVGGCCNRLGRPGVPGAGVCFACPG